MALKRDVLAINVDDLAPKRADAAIQTAGVVIRIARAGGGAPSLFCPSLSLEAVVPVWKFLYSVIPT